MKKEVLEALKFLAEAGYPVASTEDIHEGLVSLYEAVLEVLDASGIEYDEKIDETIKQALEEYKSFEEAFNTFYTQICKNYKG